MKLCLLFNINSVSTNYLFNFMISMNMLFTKSKISVKQKRVIYSSGKQGQRTEKKTGMQIYNCSVIYILLKLSKTTSCQYNAFKSWDNWCMSGKMSWIMKKRKGLLARSSDGIEKWHKAKKNLGCLENGFGLRMKGVQEMAWSHPNAFKKEVVTRQEYALKDSKVWGFYSYVLLVYEEMLKDHTPHIILGTGDQIALRNPIIRTRGKEHSNLYCTDELEQVISFTLSNWSISSRKSPSRYRIFLCAIKSGYKFI